MEVGKFTFKQKRMPFLWMPVYIRGDYAASANHVIHWGAFYVYWQAKKD